MNMNRLDLDFKIASDTARAEYVQKYLQSPEFDLKPPTPKELETISNYILWGRKPSGKNSVQEGELEILTVHSNWQKNSAKTESLEALLESPGFNESTLVSIGPPLQKKREVFDREKCRGAIDGEIAQVYKDLWERIDTLDLTIQFYELSHHKRTAPANNKLLYRLTPDQITQCENTAANWTEYQHSKACHLLIELRREQYTLRDSYNPQILQHQILPQITDKLEFDSDIQIFPLGTVKTAPLCFREQKDLNPFSYTDAEVREVINWYWMKDKNYRALSTNQMWFDFRNENHVYQLLLASEDMSDAGANEDVFSGTQELMDTLKYYQSLADLSDLHQDILGMKIKKIINADIAVAINRKYHKTYTVNYISTIFKQKIVPSIAAAAKRHQDIIANLSFPENFKMCVDCAKWYLCDTNYFMKRARSSDGFSNQCKKCAKLERERNKR